MHLPPSAALDGASLTSQPGRKSQHASINHSVPDGNFMFRFEVCKKCDIDLNKRAGELTTDEVNKIVAVVSKPLEFKIPAWMLNRNRDVKDGKTGQKYANVLDQALREDACLKESWPHTCRGCAGGLSKAGTLVMWKF